MRILAIPLAPNVYRVTVRDPGGALLARLTGPPAWVLEQLAESLAPARIGESSESVNRIAEV